MLKVYAITDIGNERAENQDGFMVDGIRCERESHREIYYETDAQNVHVALFDGVGSTQYACDAVSKAQEYLSNHLYISNEEDLEKSIIDMNEYVHEYLFSNGLTDGACTVAGIVINKQSFYIYNIGDSSVFSVNNGYLEKQTIDDYENFSYGEQEVPDDCLQVKPALVQSIGTKRLIEKVHINVKRDETAFLICTDGITDLLSIDEMEDILESSDSIKDIAQELVRAANVAGGSDNSTVIILVNEED